MMQGDKISVIIPVYNGEKYINRCLDSLKLQVYENFECIIVDDGSTDSSLEIAKKYSEEDKRFVVFHIANSGVSVARNFGLDKSTGTYITFVDVDDWVDNNIYKIAMDNVHALDCDIFQWGFFQTDSNKVKPVNMKSEFIKSENIPSSWNPVWSKLIKASIIRDNNIRFPEKISVAEDLYFTFLVFFHAKKIYNSSECLYYYFDNKESAIHSYTEQKIKDEVEIVKKIENYILINPEAEETYISFIKKKKELAKNKFLLLLEKPDVVKWKTTFPEINDYLYHDIKNKNFFFYQLIRINLKFLIIFLIKCFYHK